jgi:heme exporter protein D
VLLRKIFLWSNIVVSLSFLAVLIIGRVTYEYAEVKEMMQEEDKERLRKDEISLERTLSKIIPDIFSYWTLGRAILVVLASLFLIEIQKQEEDEAELVD